MCVYKYGSSCRERNAKMGRSFFQDALSVEVANTKMARAQVVANTCVWAGEERERGRRDEISTCSSRMHP